MSQLVEVDKTGDLVPELAESWEPGDSPSTWIFNLRKDVTFHDGKSFDADDVVGTILYHSSEESKSAMKPTFKTIKELKADTKYRVVMTLDGPNAHFPFLMSSFDIRSIRDGKIYDIGNGTGSYVLKDFMPGQRLTMERNPNFWRKGLGHFDSAEIITILDTAARQNALISGEVDVINSPDRKTWKRLKAAKGVDVVKVNAKLHRTWPMQSDTPPFDNNDVRLALKYAVDREELVEKVLNGTGSVGNDHPISPINKYFNTELPQRVYDPDKAKFHLKKAGMETLTVKLSTSEGIWDGAMDAALL
ncbi:MAG: ABC transporter substrate-binding protein, partial [Pirellulaceae bacterium]|nr:ABC transporter substrate-binding protein [Pirellulaceae bacterium]